MKTLKYITIAASALLLAASCQKAPVKSEVEAGFAPKGAAPTATINISDFTIVELKGQAEVTATFSGLAGQDSLEVGFLVSEKPDFINSTSYIMDVTADGTYSYSVKVKTGTKNYVRAMAASTNGASFSEVLELDVPKIEWYKALAAEYNGDLYSYWDEGACSYSAHPLAVTFDLENKKMTISNIDAWAHAQGVPTSLTGDVDLDARTVTFTSETGMFDTGVGAHGFMSVSLDPEAFAAGNVGLLKSIVFTFSEDGQQLSAPLYATIESASGNFADIFLPCVYTAK